MILFLIYSAHRPYKKIATEDDHGALLTLPFPPSLHSSATIRVDLLITLFSLAHVGVCDEKRKKRSCHERLTFDPTRLRCRWRDQFFVRARHAPFRGIRFRDPSASPLPASCPRVSFHLPCLGGTSGRKTAPGLPLVMRERREWNLVVNQLEKTVHHSSRPP